MSHEPIGQHRTVDLAASERHSPNCLRHWRLRADRTNGYALVRIAIRHGNALLSADPGVGRPPGYGVVTQITWFSVALSSHLSSLVGERIGLTGRVLLALMSLNVMLE
jgi:hypothetical protein